MQRGKQKDEDKLAPDFSTLGFGFQSCQRQKPNPGPILGSKSDRRPYTIQQKLIK